MDIFYTVKSDGWDIHVREQRPPKFDPEKKYPVIFSVYGGPKYYQITDKYRKSTEIIYYDIYKYKIFVVNAYFSSDTIISVEYGIWSVGSDMQ